MTCNRSGIVSEGLGESARLQEPGQPEVSAAQPTGASGWLSIAELKIVAAFVALGGAIAAGLPTGIQRLALENVLVQANSNQGAAESAFEKLGDALDDAGIPAPSDAAVEAFAALIGADGASRE